MDMFYLQTFTDLKNQVKYKYNKILLLVTFDPHLIRMRNTRKSAINFEISKKATRLIIQ